MLLSLCACSFNANIKYTPGKGADVNGPQSGAGEEQAAGIEEMIEKYHKDSSRDIKAYLLLGVDRPGVATEVGTDVGGGQSDGIYVIAMDNDNKSVKILQLNRDTYTDIVIPDIFGNELTTVKDRLGLAFASGTGMEDSCINAEKSISRFLHGLEFDGYVAVYYDAIAPVVDSVGGVDLVIEDDMTAVSSDFVKGAKLHVDGNGAYQFCRARTAVGDQANTGRMRRQRAFLDSFIGTCRAQIKEKSGIINDIYNASSPYIVSNLSQGELCNIGAKALGYSNGGIVTPAGKEEWVTGDDGIRFNQFIVDESSLSALLKDLFALEK